MSTELEDRLTAATTAPSRPLDIDATIESGLRARRRRRIARTVAATSGVAAVIVAVVIVGGPGPAVPPIDPPAISAEESAPVEVQEPAHSDESATIETGELSPSAEHLDGPLDFEVYGIVPPQGWQLVSAGTADNTYEAALGLVWFHSRWTPDGNTSARGDDPNQEHGDRLDLRQTHTATVEQHLGSHLEQDGWRPIELDGLTIHVFGDQPLVRWELHGTYLEMSAQGLDQDDLLTLVRTARQLPDTSMAQLPDGEHFGLLTAFTPTRLTIDPAELLTGEQARAAAVEDGELAPGEELPNDFYLRNPDPTTIELPVADSFAAELLDNTEIQHRPVTTDELAALYDGTSDASWIYDRLERLPVEITVKDGEIVHVSQRYLP